LINGSAEAIAIGSAHPVYHVRIGTSVAVGVLPESEIRPGIDRNAYRLLAVARVPEWTIFQNIICCVLRHRIAQEAASVNHRPPPRFVLDSCYEVVRLIEGHIRPAATRLKIEAKESRVVGELLPVSRSHKIIELVTYIPGWRNGRHPKAVRRPTPRSGVDLGWIFEGSAFACLVDDSGDAVVDGLHHVDCIIVVKIDDGVDRSW
jgi:hypothetical protein